MTKVFRLSSATIVALGVLAAGLVFNTQSRADSASDNSDASKIQQGFAIAPVLLNLQGKNRSRVGMGSYLVNAIGGCNDCHTWRKTAIPPNFGTNYEDGGDPYLGQPERIYRAGYLAGGRDFGPFRSRNLTPDSTGKVADGYETFKQMLRTGLDPDHLTPVLQVMPWPVHRNMTDNDLQAIYEYLTAIPCVEGNPGESLQNPDGGVTHRCH